MAVEKDKKDLPVEDVADEEILIEEEAEETGGPPDALIRTWKERYGRVYLVLDEEGSPRCFRPLTRAEYKLLSKTRTDDVAYADERVCEMCLLWPEGFSVATSNEFPAGLPSVMSEAIMQKSGFGGISPPVEL